MREAKQKTLLVNNEGKRKVYFNEYNVIMPHTAYIPLATGLICAYAKKFPEINQAYEFMPFLFLRDNNLEHILSQYNNPAVAAFSLSMWNAEYSLVLAKELKQRYPNCVIIMGGAHVPHAPEEFFMQHKFVDVTVRGDGEIAFAGVLKRLLHTDDLSGIPLVSWRSQATGECIVNPEIPVFEKDLDIFPSPYLDGLYDYLFDAYPDINFQAIIETDRGCPFPCSYCYWGQGGLNQKYRLHSLERIRQELEWVAEHNIKYVFNAASNFGIHKRDVDIAKMLVELKTKHEYPEKFRSCYTKNAEETIFTIATMLHAGEIEKGITLSYQSLNKTALENVRRKNIKSEIYQALQKRFNEKGIPVYTELILGLPGETCQSWIDGIESLFRLGLQNQLFIYICQVYPNTHISEKEYQKQHGIVTRKIFLTETHGEERAPDSISEFENIVIATNTMPTADWSKALIFSWLTMTMMSLKIGFFILMYMRNRHGLGYTDFINFIISNGDNRESLQAVSSEISAFHELVETILQGNGRCRRLKDFENIYWDEEEASFLRILSKKDAFYNDIFCLAGELFKDRGIDYSQEELREVIEYQKIRVPGWTLPDNTSYRFEFNIPEFFDESTCGNVIELQRKPQQMTLVSPVDFQGDKVRFAREVLLWGRKNDNILTNVKWHNE